MYTVIYGTEETSHSGLDPAIQDALSRAGSELRRDCDGARYNFYANRWILTEPIGQPLEWISYYAGRQEYFQGTLEECRAVLKNLGISAYNEHCQGSGTGDPVIDFQVQASFDI